MCIITVMEKLPTTSDHDEQGQTAVEYALVTSFCVIILIGVTIALLGAVSNFYIDITRIICLPLP